MITVFIPNPVFAEQEYGGIDIHGFISQGYLKTDDNNYLAETEDGSFQFNEMGINFTTEVNSKLRLGIQLFAMDMGINGNDKIKLDWASADFRWKDWLGIQVGRNKVRNSFYMETRDLDMLRTSVLLPQSVYSDLVRDTFSSARGVEIYGRFLLGPAGILFYYAGLGVANYSKDTGFAYVFSEAFASQSLEITGVTADMTPAGGFTWHTPLEGFRIKTGTFLPITMTITGNFPSGTKFEYCSEFGGYYTSMEYAFEKLKIVGEFLTLNFEGKWDLGLGFEDRDPISYQGWYIAVNYDFTQFFKTSLSYAESYPDTNNRDGKKTYSSSMYNDIIGLTDDPVYKNDFEAWLKTWTCSIRIDLNEYWLFKFEVAYNDGFGAYTSAKNDDDGDGKLDIDRYWVLYAAKVTFIF